jgi:hypothetical protein
MMVQHYSRAEQHYLSSMIGVKASKMIAASVFRSSFNPIFGHANQQAYSLRRKIFLTLL